MRIGIPKLGSVIFSQDKGQAILTADLMFATNLRVVHTRDGRVIEDRDLGSGLVTTAGAILLATGIGLNTFNWHQSGTSTQSPLISDASLYSPVTGVARVIGYASGVSNVYQSVASVTYPTAQQVSEWGLFSAVTGGTMWDRRTFTVFNILTNDTLQFIYQLTINPGG